MAVDPNMPILIVDDYKVMIRIIRNQLGEIGFSNVDEAYDGNDALAKLQDGEFRLLIGSWNMEPMNGLDLLREIRGDDSLKDLPFILVTAENGIETVAAARKAGVSNYIARPFNAEMLKATVESVVGEL